VSLLIVLLLLIALFRVTKLSFLPLKTKLDLNLFEDFKDGYELVMISDKIRDFKNLGIEIYIMSSVLYYSNHCGHCKNILLMLSKSSIKSDIHFLCIDKRFKIDDKIYIILENGEKILLPNTITKVPALMLLSRNNETIFGEKIQDHFNVLINNTKTIEDSRQQEMEPQSYDLTSMQGFVKSDNYSFVDMSPEELGAKGNTFLAKYSFCKKYNEYFE
jgi:hypothetical protein